MLVSGLHSSLCMNNDSTLLVGLVKQSVSTKALLWLCFYNNEKKLWHSTYGLCQMVQVLKISEKK